MIKLAVFEYVMVFGYLLFVLALGIWAGRKVKGLNDYAVASRSYGALIVFMTLSASFIGGGFTMGNAEKVFLIGIANIVCLWGFSLKEILVASFIAPRMNNFPDAISVGDVMEKNYGKPGKIITGIFSVFLCAGILGAQVGGIGYISNLFLGIPVVYGILIGTGIVIAYDTVGGMRAVVATDVLQFATLALGIPLTLVLGIHYVGGGGNIFAKVPEAHFSILGTMTVLKFVSLFLTFLLGETLVPPYVRRLFIGKDQIHTAKGTLWSGIFSIPFFFITGAIGLIALVINPQLDANLALPTVIGTVLPTGIRAMVIAAVIAVVMSSADSFLNSASIAFIQDIVRPFSRHDLSDKKGLLLARASTLVTGALAIIFAVKIRSILDILIYAYNFWAPIILVPLAATLLGIKSNRTTFLFCSIAGILGVVVWDYFLKTPGEFSGLIIGVMTNMTVFVIAQIVSNFNKR
ncbi:MAG: sodium:solute symporter family protein [Thermodesulfobacteriota bacterium]|nr:sodium:solute symporter family protein [Thermodesulfobacteriota bacterium]